MNEIVTHALGLTEKILKSVADESYQKGLKEGLARLEVLSLIVPESTTKKKLIQLLKLEVKTLKKKAGNGRDH